MQVRHCRAAAQLAALAQPARAVVKGVCAVLAEPSTGRDYQPRGAPCCRAAGSQHRDHRLCQGVCRTLVAQLRRGGAELRPSAEVLDVHAELVDEEFLLLQVQSTGGHFAARWPRGREYLGVPYVSIQSPDSILSAGVVGRRPSAVKAHLLPPSPQRSAATHEDVIDDGWHLLTACNGAIKPQSTIGKSVPCGGNAASP